MPFNETRKCNNCLFRLVLEDQIDRCRFNAPQLLYVMKQAEDMTKFNKTIFAPCPGPACAQWQPEAEVIEIEETVNEVPTIKE